eukprot:NODE_1669_length_1097_cov_76.975191_g1365_i0.p1 GENE.NODE_1669_length_1097_cov_76.975191_g1365_i0~~NODE_1669_length_1097_cov_76.975191_g1365_i0.p1  ORF type:complete len:230 (+),score=49.07 NODE_1669_length_1097_cov_76.975191_g1365_i0:285-974(+)
MAESIGSDPSAAGSAMESVLDEEETGSEPLDPQEPGSEHSMAHSTVSESVASESAQETYNTRTHSASPPSTVSSVRSAHTPAPAPPLKPTVLKAPLELPLETRRNLSSPLISRSPLAGGLTRRTSSRIMYRSIDEITDSSDSAQESPALNARYPASQSLQKAPKVFGSEAPLKALGAAPALEAVEHPRPVPTTRRRSDVSTSSDDLSSFIAHSRTLLSTMKASPSSSIQ